MKTLKILFTLTLTLTLFSCHVGRMIIYNVSDVNDYKKFPQITLNHPAESFQFAEEQKESLDTNIFPKSVIPDEKITDFTSLFEQTKTTSFLIVKNDIIVYEEYFYDHDKNSLFTSFSVAKSYISALVGIAVDEGYIGSVQDSITTYLTDFENPGFGKITIEHLLNMESGIRFRENYFNPFAEITRYYYGLNLRKYVPKLKIEEDPGTYHYKSVNTLLLGMILEKATGIPLEQYFQEKIWTPLGMESDGTLNIDSEKSHMVKSFCGVNSTSRDYAKFGRLYLNKGMWNGKRILSEEWILKSISHRSGQRSSIYYSYQWRSDNDGNFWAQGHLGQFIFVNPSQNIIIIRTGKKYGGVNWPLVLARISQKI